MKKQIFDATLHERLGSPSSETVQSLRLLKAFLKLPPSQRAEVIALVQRLANEAGAAADRSTS